MIAQLHGKVTSAGGRSLTIEQNNVGFEVFVIPSLAITAPVGSDIILHTHLHVREDALELYGFKTTAERDFFRQLIAISGVGPKSALGVLSVAAVDEVKQAVAAGDPTLLTKVAGIGRKTAERIVVELKEKMTAEVLSAAGTTTGDGSIMDALMKLGYSMIEAREAVRAIPVGLTGLDERLKAALRALGKK